MQVGDVIKVLPPFDKAYPDECKIEGISETGAWVVCGSDFDERYLTLVKPAAEASAEEKQKTIELAERMIAAWTGTKEEAEKTEIAVGDIKR